ncbi:MAG: ABC transporter permease [Desulfobacteraceae bacterium]
MITLWVIITLNFLLPRIMPGDPFLHLSAEDGEDVANFSEAQKAYYEKQYGMDRPLWVQYSRYLMQLLRGDLGYSIYYNENVATILLRRLPWTFALVVISMGVGAVLGSLLGGISAYYRQGWVDRTLFFGMMAWAEMPAFLLGLLLLFLFAAHFDLFPLSGAMTPFTQYPNLWAQLVDLIRHAFLPAVTLTLAIVPALYLLSRSSMVTVMTKDYLRTARAKGLRPVRIFFRHILRNALLPMVTLIFMRLGNLLGGAILVENVFKYPGLGMLMHEAVIVHDYPMVQGIFLLMTLSVLFVNFCVDWGYGWLDPRIRSTKFSLQSRSVPS